MQNSGITRRRFLQCAGLGAAGMTAILGDALFIEPQRLVVERVTAELPCLHSSLDGLRVVQLSDFHYVDSRDGEFIRSAVELANSLHPDLVVLTGDYVSISGHGWRHAARQATPCAQVLSGLQAPLGIFAVLGNHDQCDPDFVARALTLHGITVMRNQALFVEYSGIRLWISGVEDVLGGNARLDEALYPIPPGEATILLAHEPDFADVTRHFPVALQLSGHSHGGQIRLPLLGIPYLPPLARKYPSGYRRLGSLSLYTNRGLGTTSIPMRFDAPPEVTLLTLETTS